MSAREIQGVHRVYLRHEIMQTLAEYCEQNNKMQEAAFFYERSGDFDKESGNYVRAAEIYESLGNFEEAESSYCLAMRWHDRARMMEKAGKEEVALIEYMRLHDADSVERIFQRKKIKDKRDTYRSLLYEAHAMNEDDFMINLGERLGLLKTAAAIYRILENETYRSQVLHRINTLKITAA